MSPFDHKWQKLTALARQAPVDPATEIPPGFATRVVARAESRPLPGWSVLERFALRGFVAAVGCCAAAVVFNYFNLGPESVDEGAFDYTAMTVAVDVS